MSIKACHVLEANMGVLKEDVKQFVGDLMTERTHLKRDNHEINWLTCTKVEREDLPWYVAPVAGKGDSLKTLYEAMDQEQAAGSNLGSKGKAKAAAAEAKRVPTRPRKRARIVNCDTDNEDADSVFVPDADT